MTHKKASCFGLIYCALFFLCLGPSASTGLAQEPVIYPAKGQSAEQMEKDKFECYTWAKKQTGFDPMQAKQAPPPSSQGPTGERAKGAARGAAGGAIVGAVAGDAGKGAAVGAAAGTVRGGMKKRQQKRQEEQAKQQQAASAAAGRNDYSRAFGACLEGRGYTVK